MRQRDPSKTDFKVPVEGVGDFVFAKRMMRDELAIQVEYSRIIQGVEPTEWLALVAGWIASLKVLTVFAPSDWDIDEMDPLDKDTYAKLAKVHGALVEKESSFRRKPGVGVQEGGQGAGGDDPVLVSPEVQPDQQ